MLCGGDKRQLCTCAAGHALTCYKISSFTCSCACRRTTICTPHGTLARLSAGAPPPPRTTCGRGTTYGAQPATRWWRSGWRQCEMQRTPAWSRPSRSAVRARPATESWALLMVWCHEPEACNLGGAHGHLASYMASRTCLGISACKPGLVAVCLRRKPLHACRQRGGGWRRGVQLRGHCSAARPACTP